MDLTAFIDGELTNLAGFDERFAGIWAVLDGAERPKVGVTDQFLANAAEYHRAYLSLDYWDWLVGRALDGAGVRDEVGTIIDIGSGSGNSVIPLMRRFPRAQVVATDISAELLAILRDFLGGEARGPDARIALLCADAAALRFRPGVADLVVGGAILHHIIEPERVIAAAARALRPGGWAVFIEPFESGGALLSMLYQRILAEASPPERDLPAFRVLARIANDYRVRSRPKTDPVFLGLDDKWLFSREFFETLRAPQGWDEVRYVPLGVGPHSLRDQTRTFLSLGGHLTPDALPDWAWRIVDESDAGLSLAAKREMPMECVVLLRRGATR